jgi:predicted RNase H-like HicB family nuclease
MKTLKCDLCEVTAEGETFEEWMKALMPHYMEVHADAMQKTHEMPKEDQEKHRQKWMDENKVRFDAV